MKLQQTHAYESPKMEVIDIENPTVLCSSAPQPSVPNPSGSTESVGRSSFGF